MKANAYTLPRITVNHLTVYHDLAVIAKRNAQQQQRSLRQVGLGVHIKPAHADILSAGYSGRIFAIEENVYDQSRAVTLSPFFRRGRIVNDFITHRLYPLNDSGVRYMSEPEAIATG